MSSVGMLKEANINEDKKRVNYPTHTLYCPSVQYKVTILQSCCSSRERESC